jgi:hypothetical protein
MVDVARQIERLRAARSRVITAAANWQRDGTDTSALAAPLVELQEAIYLLETSVPGEADADRLRRLGRALGEHFDAVRASGAGLETEESPLNRMRWLDLMDLAADQCIATVARMEPLFPDD